VAHVVADGSGRIGGVAGGRGVAHARPAAWCTAVVDGAPTAEVVEMLAIGDDVVSEDPEFYTWLADRGLPADNGSG